MVGGHLRPAAGEFDARGPRFGPGRVFRRVIGKKFEVGADGTRVVGGVFGVALSDGNIGSEVYGDSGAAFEMFDTIFQLLERFQPPHPQVGTVFFRHNIQVACSKKEIFYGCCSSDGFC